MQDQGDPIQLTSHKYGCPTNPKPSTHMNSNGWTTTQRVSYPKKAASFFNAKTGFKTLSTEDSIKSAYGLKPGDAFSSGYLQNHQCFDGKGFKPQRNMNSDMIRTEYRIRYNVGKPVHGCPSVPRLRGDTQFKWKTYNDLGRQ